MLVLYAARAHSNIYNNNNNNNIHLISPLAFGQKDGGFDTDWPCISSDPASVPWFGEEIRRWTESPSCHTVEVTTN